MGDYPDDWEERREQVLQRDGYECQRCGEADVTLQVHHQTAISEGGTHALSNLTPVCRSCHAAQHPTRVVLLQAVAENRRLRMKYRFSSGTRAREVDPYGVGIHEGIQYLVGHDSYRDEIRIFHPTRIEWAELLTASFEPPDGWDTEGYLADEMGYRRTEGCFNATAAYGSASEWELEVLRGFRDDFLAESKMMRWMIPSYYRLSPPIARWNGRSKWRRQVARTLLVDPLVRLVRLIFNEGE